jgi:hypothetical protein
MAKRRTPIDSLDDNKAFQQFSKRALAGLTQSPCMIGVFDDGRPRYEFMLQVGHCLVEDKPLLLIVPEGAKIPDKLRAAATAVETYRPDDMESMYRATQRALKVIGIEKAH